MMVISVVWIPDEENVFHFCNDAINILCSYEICEVSGFYFFFMCMSLKKMFGLTLYQNLYIALTAEIYVILKMRHYVK